MAASRPSTFPSSNSIIRPPEKSKADVVTTSNIFPQINRADSRSGSVGSGSIIGSGSGSGSGGGSRGSVTNYALPLSRPANNNLGDRRARPSLAPLRIDSLNIWPIITPSTAEEPRDQGEPREPREPGRRSGPAGSQTATSATFAWQSPSAPIPIPRRQKSTAPTTPLTARESKGGHFPFVTRSPAESSQSTSSTSSREYHQPHLAPASATASATATASIPPTEAQKTARKSPIMHDQPLPRYNPSTPFSPAMPLPLSPLQPMSQNPHLPRRAGKSLHLTPLPRFHPANYPSAESGQNAIHRGLRSSVPQRHGSDASQQLHQYRRDLVDSTVMTARSLMSPKLGKPTSPRLHPLGSPGPVTPLMLEGHDDYLLGGSAVSPDDFTAPDGRAFVDRLIREEHDRIKRPGIHSARHSPAVSPAVGRGEAAYRS